MRYLSFVGMAMVVLAVHVGRGQGIPLSVAAAEAEGATLEASDMLLTISLVP